MGAPMKLSISGRARVAGEGREAPVVATTRYSLPDLKDKEL